MNSLPPRAPSDARRSRKKAEQYIETNLALINAPEVLLNKQKRLERSVGEFFATAVEADLAAADFAEAHHGAP